jgi:hypothetical protein
VSENEVDQEGKPARPRYSEGDYRVARQASGFLLIALVVVMVLLDAFRGDFEASPLVLVPILLTAAAMFAVDVPGIRGPRK